MGFARLCMEHAQAGPDWTAARSLQHARKGYDLANRLLAKNTMIAASEASLRDELSALRSDLEQAEALQNGQANV